MVGLALILFSVFEWQRQVRTFEWPTVPGMMIQSDLKNHGKGNWSEAVAYSYEVGNKSYAGQRVTLWLSEASDLRVRSLLADHLAGSTVQVHYDPHNPQNAVLLPGYDRQHLVGLGGVGLILVVGAGLVRLVEPPKR